MTQEERTAEIYACLMLLQESDDRCLEYVDGALDEEEYSPIRAQRQTLRARVRELQAEDSPS